MKAFKCEKCDKFTEGKALRWFAYWSVKTKCYRKIDLCKECLNEIQRLLDERRSK